MKDHRWVSERVGNLLYQMFPPLLLSPSLNKRPLLHYLHSWITFSDTVKDTAALSHAISHVVPQIILWSEPTMTYLPEIQNLLAPFDLLCFIQRRP